MTDQQKVMGEGYCRELETDDGYIVLSQFAPFGQWAHNVLYRYVWQTSSGPNSEIIPIMVAFSDDADLPTAEMQNMLEAARKATVAAIEKWAT